MQSAITRDQYDAVFFDLDGVITNTADIHATCWKQMFDAYLQQRAADTSTLPLVEKGPLKFLYPSMNARELRIERKLAEKRRAAKAAPEPDLAIPLAPPENPLRGKVLPSQEEDGLLRNVLALNEGKARLILMDACLKLRGEAAAELHVVDNPFILGAAAKEQEALPAQLQGNLLPGARRRSSRSVEDKLLDSGRVPGSNMACQCSLMQRLWNDPYESQCQAPADRARAGFESRHHPVLWTRRGEQDPRHYRAVTRNSRSDRRDVAG